VNGRTVTGTYRVPRHLWGEADEAAREALRDMTRQALAEAIVRELSPPVIVVEAQPVPEKSA
jgi:hypothetical protein